MKRLIACASLAVVSMLLWLPGLEAAKDTQVSVTDQAFAMMAAEGGLAEVQLGKLAADQAASPEVKQLGQLLVQDHTAANQELVAIAKQKNISLPDEVDDTHEDVVELFSRLEGAQFDREFLRYQIMHHEKDVAGFGVQAKEGQDPELRAFAQKQLPALQKHLQQIRNLAAQHHTTGKGGQAGEQRGTR